MSDYTLNGKAAAIQWTGSNLSTIQSALSPSGWTVFSSTQRTDIGILDSYGDLIGLVPLNSWIVSGPAYSGTPAFNTQGFRAIMDNASFVSGYTTA